VLQSFSRTPFRLIPSAFPVCVLDGLELVGRKARIATDSKNRIGLSANVAIDVVLELRRQPSLEVAVRLRGVEMCP
jgi:hypothetical protein